jgi:hypothetical protein
MKRSLMRNDLPSGEKTVAVSCHVLGFFAEIRRWLRESAVGTTVAPLNSEAAVGKPQIS